MKKTLNDIIKDFKDIEESLIESEGEITSEIEKMMEWVQEELSDKLDGYASFIAYLKGQVQYLKEQEEHFRRRRTTVDNTIKQLQNRMVLGMKEVGQDKVKTAIHNYSIRKTQSWKIEDESLNNKDFQDRLILEGLGIREFKPSITEIKRSYKDDDVPDWIIITEKESIYIR